MQVVHKFAILDPPTYQLIQRGMSISHHKCTLAHKSPLFFNGNVLMVWEWFSPNAHALQVFLVL